MVYLIFPQIALAIGVLTSSSFICGYFELNLKSVLVRDVDVEISPSSGLHSAANWSRQEGVVLWTQPPPKDRILRVRYCCDLHI